MKFKATHSLENHRNTHSITMSMALRKISSTTLDDLQRIANDLETGIQNKQLNTYDAKQLLGKVRMEIANRHFH